jgi:hypothetical protein
VALSHVLPCFPILILSLLHLMIFRYPYLILEFFGAMDSTLHFLHIYRLSFYLKKKILPSNFEKILWNNKFFKVPLVEIIFYENQDGICFLWNLGLWILTIQTSHSYTLAYCRPIHLNSIEFQSIDNNPDFLPKKLFFPLQLL